MENVPENDVVKKSLLKETWYEISQPFKDLFKTSRALAGVNISYAIEGLIYFGMLSLLALYFNDYVGLNDDQAAKMVGILTGGITLAMLFLGATVDFIGVRKSLMLAIFFMLIGRIFITVSPVFGGQGMWSPSHSYAMFGILWIIIGNGIYQPAAYAAVKFFTNKKTSAMGFAMLYGLMNLGAFLPGLISPPVRRAFGMTGVFWVYIALTIVGLLVVAFMITKKAAKEAHIYREEEEESTEEKVEGKNWSEKAIAYIKRFPITDLRFIYFIFILIPVQTLFAHQWLTMPIYCKRAFSGVVSDNFEFFSNINPILIFVLTPVVTAFTSKKNTYTMMIAGTFVMALPTFILALGPNIYTLIVYLIFMTIGEAMWQPRFLQWIAEIAPKGMTGIYMGIGQFPWFLTKIITSLYSGIFLMKYCPEGVLPSQTNTEMMWLIYGFIAIISPIGLIISKKWMMKRFQN
ncbi:MAG TPA: MFS transporter [Ignavibacteriaceae bacterium]|nr:MFS transporter [Ignavibacteriaceae bacterium]